LQSAQHPFQSARQSFACACHNELLPERDDLVEQTVSWLKFVLKVFMEKLSETLVTLYRVSVFDGASVPWAFGVTV
jgi:hypothetical protein